MKSKFHPFHMVTVSPWPTFTAFSIWGLTSMTVITFVSKTMSPIFVPIFLICLMSFFWWKDVVRETTVEGFHHSDVLEGLSMGMTLFISSEVFFFLSFFWAYFHSSISPCVEIGQAWPPLSITSFDPMNVPLLNTVILLSSGVTVTWCHHSFLVNDFSVSNISLALTCLLGVYFTMLQGLEYWQASFCISDACYGSTFFMATGFHGAHVIIGTTFLIICWLRMTFYQNNMSHLLGFEMAAWYWHFVDVVWLFLYTSIYWWGV